MDPFKKKYRFWTIALIVGLPVWAYFSIFSVFLFDSGPAAWAYVAASAIWIVGPFSIIFLLTAYAQRVQNPKKALFLLRLPFWYGMILAIVFAGLLVNEEVHYSNRVIPPPTTTTDSTQQSMTVATEARIDSASLTPPNFESAPTITGTAQGGNTIRLLIETPAGMSMIDTNISVVDGIWSYKVPEGRILQPGVYDVTVSNIQDTKLAEGKLVIRSYGD